MISIEFRFEEIRQRQRNEFSLPIPLHHNMQKSEKQNHKVYTEKKEWSNDDLKQLTLSQEKQMQQEMKKREQQKKEESQITRQVKAKFETKTTAELKKFLQKEKKNKTLIEDQISETQNSYQKHVKRQQKYKNQVSEKIKRHDLAEIINLNELIEQIKNQVRKDLEKQIQLYKKLDATKLKCTVLQELIEEREYS